MTDMTAKFYNVTSFDGRLFPLDERRQAGWFLFVDVTIGIGTVAAACAFVTTVAAAWLINNAFATTPNIHAKAPIGPAVIALANQYPTLASAADFTGSARDSADPTEALTFEAKWAYATDEIARFPVRQAAPQVATATPPPTSNSEKRVTSQQAQNKPMSLPDPDSHTAVYDIAAHTVYLPNGDWLEAHSGRGNQLDDPRYVSVKDQGPTPPNVYDLALRDHLFHGVPVIRLNPVDAGSMFGRDGILAHPYMMGANGQSNGCVSFKDYPAFLRAYLRGEIDRFVVVPYLGNTSWRTASGRRGPVRRYADNNL